MSTAHIDIGYDLIKSIFTALDGYVYRRRDRVTLTGTDGTALVTCGGVARTATFHTSLTVTASDFVTAHAAAYLAVGIVITSSAAVITFTGLAVATRFTGATTITNATLTLAGTVAAADEVFPVYKSIPKPSADTYVHITNLLYDEDGTKDDFLYLGTIQVEVVDETKHTPDRTLAQQMLGLVRGLLKPTRTSVPSVTGHTLVYFSPGPYGEITEKGDAAPLRLRLIDTYNFLFE